MKSLLHILAMSFQVTIIASCCRGVVESDDVTELGDAAGLMGPESDVSVLEALLILLKELLPLILGKVAVLMRVFEGICLNPVG